MDDVRSDAELLSALRGGERDAYVALWTRHVNAALRYAGRLSPSRAEDLVSESFLAIYQQVTTTPKGPQFAFRSYLKAVMRNTAIRWSKDASQVVDAVDVEQIDHRDALSVVETASAASELLSAFQELPERWQRVLWLAEVAEVGRPQIAEELGIKPNAVSALQRRARAGLKTNWLTRQIPLALREDESHVARLLPAHLSNPADEVVSAEVLAHVASCDVCSDLLHGMRGAAVRLENTTLAAAGFGALGTALPAAAALVPTSSAVATFAFLGGSTAAIGAGVIVTGLSALTISGVIFSTWLTGPPAEVVAAPASSSSVSSDPSPENILELLRESALVLDDPTRVPEDPTIIPAPPVLGRWNTDPTIESIDLTSDPTFEFPVQPATPKPSEVPPPGPDDPANSLTPEIATPRQYTGYYAPVITGTAKPGSTVAVEYGGRQYTAASTEDGSWSFDPRDLVSGTGPHEYRVWAFDETSQSPAVTGTFTILPIVVEGLENTTGEEDMHVDEASTTGIVIAITGPPNGVVQVSSMTGDFAMVELDATGYTVKRLRMHAPGWYYFSFSAYDADGFWGPAFEDVVDVYDPDVIWGPWGPDPEDMSFDLTDP
ncbi:sigma-70 family RNA polymerase sigma factor [Microbacterium murale]|uniref:RNA polymerase sigma factor (Sigma-70 family) n=1 Tax=Microbacterium murale TaxID=1081040 RepID=A0ABU0PB53_9MICO|nr:sigma-70 family RNA polymerase sigma factor [Microbacterium murale]MDQ0644564.1 RNA polymerase sigma factor (sigma-70 family) [Microbacterium murale]